MARKTGKNEKNDQSSTAHKALKIKDFFRTFSPKCLGLSSQARYDHFDTLPDSFFAVRGTAYVIIPKARKKIKGSRESFAKMRCGREKCCKRPPFLIE